MRPCASRLPEVHMSEARKTRNHLRMCLDLLSIVSAIKSYLEASSSSTLSLQDLLNISAGFLCWYKKGTTALLEPLQHAEGIDRYLRCTRSTNSTTNLEHIHEWLLMMRLLDTFSSSGRHSQISFQKASHQTFNALSL